MESTQNKLYEIEESGQGQTLYNLDEIDNQPDDKKIGAGMGGDPDIPFNQDQNDTAVGASAAASSSIPPPNNLSVKPPNRIIGGQLEHAADSGAQQHGGEGLHHINVKT